MKKSLNVLMCSMMAASLCACSASNTTETTAANDTTAASAAETTTAGAASTSAIKDGTYETKAKGHGGDVTVVTTITEGKISKVEVKEHAETDGISNNAIEKIPVKIVEANSVAVDAETGATESSTAIIEAVKLAITEAGGNVDDFSAAVEATPAASSETKNLEADVVVVGSGAAGVSAALSAQDAGANVILIEKAANAGGVSIIAGGPMAINSQVQIAAGANTFTLEEVLKDWQDYNAWMSDGSLFYNIFSNSGETVDFLQQNGFDFTFMGNEQAAHADGYPTYLIYTDQENKMQYYTAAIEKFEQLGGTMYYETAGYELTSEGDVITGIKAKQADGTILDIKTDAVILCTGGFGANADMIEEKVGFPLETFTTGTQTGDGATMSQAIGAGVGKTIQQYHGVTSYSGIQTGQGKDEIAKAIYLSTSVWVNKRGSRFAPEDLNYDTALSSNAAATQGEYFYSILSEDMVDQLVQSGSSALGVTIPVAYEPTIPMFSIDEGWTDSFKKALDDGVEAGTVFKGETVEELAENMGVDAAALASTMTKYNEDCAKGTDEIFGKDATYMKAVDGPLYAVKARPVSLGGIGGVLVNSQLQVIKDDGTVIKGLYAAGNDVAEFYNNSYPLIEGVTLGSAFSGGRMCGLDAAEYSKK